MVRRKRPANPLKSKKDVLDIQDYLKYKNERDYILFLLGITTGYRARRSSSTKSKRHKTSYKIW